MKTIGLIGGLSWESSIEYYRIINETVRQKLGGLHSADCLMYSFDFQEIETLQHQNNWPEATRRMVNAAQNLEKGGAAFLMICSNTMHKMAEAVEAAVSIPLLHIADATGEQIRAAGYQSVGLLATRFTMEEDFYRGRLVERFGLDVIVPPADERDQIHAIIYDELCQGIIKDDSKRIYQQSIQNLALRGAEAVILGCTEIGLLIKPQDSVLPTFDTTQIHAEAATTFALQAGVAPTNDEFN